jgi:hypothetical protein
MWVVSALESVNESAHDNELVSVELLFAELSWLLLRRM